MRIDIYLWPKKYKRGYHLKIRVIQKRKAQYFPTEVFISDPAQWKNGMIKNHPHEIRLNRLIREKLSEIELKFLEGKPLKDSDMFSWIEEFIKNCGKSASTKKNYTTTLNKLKEFRPNMEWSDFNKSFYDNFITHLKGKEHSLNYIGKIIKVSKMFMGAGHDAGMHSNLVHSQKWFKSFSEETDSIYLTEDEITEIESLDLTGQDKHERDRLLLGCYTGLRFSDLIRIRKKHIVKDGGCFIKIKAQKTRSTNESILIPLKSKAVNILRQYDFNSPPCSVNSQSAMAIANEALKRIGVKAKLNQDILVVRTEGGKMVETVFKRWQLLSTHTGRRSFATNAWLAGVPWLSIGKITGHRTEKSLLRYIKIRQEDNAKILKDHEFFK